VNAGRFKGKLAWADELSAAMREEDVGDKLGWLPYERQNVVNWISNPLPVLQDHMTRGMW
jgi:hypothetical protein